MSVCVAVAVLACLTPALPALQSTCSASVVFREDFDDGILPFGWTAEDWIVSPPPACGTACAQGFVATYWNSQCGCISCAGGCEGDADLTSPWIALPAAAPQQRLSLEFCVGGYLDSSVIGCQTVTVESASLSRTFPIIPGLLASCNGPFFDPPIDITPFAGEIVRVSWHAALIDCEGESRMTIDDVRVVAYVDPSSADCNANGIPDECDVAWGTEVDCDANGTPDSCTVASGSTPDCNANAIPDSCDIAAGVSADFDGDGQPDECQCSETHVYCAAGTNGAGTKAKIGFTGSTSVTLNDFVLDVVDARPLELGMFVMAEYKFQKPFGGGYLCITGNEQRYLPPISLGETGAGSLAVDFLDPASPAALVQPLAEWNFQFLYRDPKPSGAQFNLSNALHAHFCP